MSELHQMLPRWLMQYVIQALGGTASSKAVQHDAWQCTGQSVLADCGCDLICKGTCNVLWGNYLVRGVQA